VWLESRKKFVPHFETARPGPQLKTDSTTAPPVNHVWNGSFEDDISDGGFDWRRKKTDGADIQFDYAIREKGRRSLRVTFHGTNIHFSHLSQVIPLTGPGEYRLQYHLKTENLTTDQRPYFTIESFPGSPETILHTEVFPGTSEWGECSFPFRVHAGTKAVKLSLRRSPSKKFDSQIQGSLWLDDIAVNIDKQPSAEEMPE